MSKAAFTLIELLIVIGILAVLASVVVLVVNPVELLRRGRDAERLQELDSLSRALSLYETDRGSSGMGSTTVVYVSIPDVSPTCANLGLPSLPLGWSYGCVTEGNLHQVDGTGWVPVDFTSISYGAPLGILPVDPTNTTSTGRYYTYVTGGSFKLSALFESSKHVPTQANDGGTDLAAYETGSDLTLAPFSHGLAGYWKLDGDYIDSSGYGNDGTPSGGVVFATGQVGQAGSFDGVDGRVSLGTVTTTVNVSVAAWIKTSTSLQRPVLSNRGQGLYFGVKVTKFFIYDNSASLQGIQTTGAINDDSWHHVVWTSNGATSIMYIDGATDRTDVQSRGQDVGNGNIGYDLANNEYYPGLIDDLRVYHRTLSASEVQAIYDATK